MIVNLMRAESTGSYSIGVDLGGTNLRIAAVSRDGVILEKIALDTEVAEGRDRVIEDMCNGISELAQRLGKKELAGIGVGLPGVINLHSGTVRQSPNLPGWADFPVQAEIERRLGTSVFLENDANSAALGEKWVGCGKNVSSLCILTLGTGIGGGLILDNHVWHGADGMGAEFGHMTIDPNGALCACGNLGCIEAYASATAIQRMAHAAVKMGRSPQLAKMAADYGEPTSEMIYLQAKQGDKLALEIFDLVGRSLAVTVGNLINAFNVPLYVLGGGVARAWDVFGPALLDELPRRSVVYRATQPRVEPSILDADAGLIGSAYLAFARGQGVAQAYRV